MKLDARWLPRTLLVLATLQFVRQMTYEMDSLDTYVGGTAQMPIQGRMLMMYPMRWAAAWPVFGHHNLGTEDSAHAVLLLAGLASMAVLALVLSLFYRRLSPRGRMDYLPYALALLACEFSNRGQVHFPYDLPSVAFFTLGLWLAYTDRFWSLLLLFPFATLNRETTLFLIPVLAANALADPQDAGWWRGLVSPKLLAKVGGLLTVWIVLHVLVRHRFAGNPVYPTERCIPDNLALLLVPRAWLLVLSACAFLLPLVFLLRSRIADPRLRLYLWIVPAWFAVMFVYANLDEIRIFGELSGLTALAATLILEQTPNQPARAPFIAAVSR